MADSFGIPQLLDYLAHMGLHIGNVDQQQEFIELAFHGTNGQWRMILSVQQNDEVRKVILISPHISTVTTKKRLKCLEALLAVNYRTPIANTTLDFNHGSTSFANATPLPNR